MEQKEELLQTNPTNGHVENYTAALHNLLIKNTYGIGVQNKTITLHLTTSLTTSPHHLTDHLTDYHHTDHLTDHHHTDHLTTPSPYHLIDYPPDHHLTDHLTEHHRTDNLTTEDSSEAVEYQLSWHNSDCLGCAGPAQVPLPSHIRTSVDQATPCSTMLFSKQNWIHIQTHNHLSRVFSMMAFINDHT